MSEQLSAQERGVLPAGVERGVTCFHGTPRACLSIRCGSNCSSRFDRMHPCPACLIAENLDLSASLAAVEALVTEFRSVYGDNPWVEKFRAALHPDPSEAGA